MFLFPLFNLCVSLADRELTLFDCRLRRVDSRCTHLTRSKRLRARLLALLGAKRRFLVLISTGLDTYLILDDFFYSPEQ